MQETGQFDNATALKYNAAINKLKNVASVSKTLLLTKFTNFPKIKAWILTLDEAIDVNLLTKLDELDANYFARLDTDLGSLSNGASLKALMKESPDDINNIWKFLKDEPKYCYDLAKTGGSRWEKWAQGNYFKTITKAGKDFEELALLELKTIESNLRIKLTDLNININEFEVFEQVQIKTGKIIDNLEEYLVADFILVKKKTNINTGIESLDYNNAIVLETKLSEGTALTTPQISALNKVKTSSNVFDIRSH